jgi:hypothetical protein
LQRLIIGGGTNLDAGGGALFRQDRLRQIVNGIHDGWEWRAVELNKF